MNKNTLRQVLVVFTTLATITINGLANALPINGQNTGEISDQFEVYFVPAGYVFSIWGLIYLLLAAYSIYQALPAQRENPRLQRTGYLYVFAGLANMAWIFLWHYEVFPATLVVMLALLGSLIAIYLRLGTGQEPASSGERWLVRLPFSVYLGWITVATIANATSLLDFLNWNGWGISPEAWAVIMLAAGVLITGGMIFTRSDLPYALVIIWAFAGIAIKHSSTVLVGGAAWAAAGVVLILLLIQLFRGKLKPLATSAA